MGTSCSSRQQVRASVQLLYMAFFFIDDVSTIKNNVVSSRWRYYVCYSKVIVGQIRSWRQSSALLKIAWLVLVVAIFATAG